MTKNADKKREQILMFCMDDMVPTNHMLRLIEKAIDWNFIYDLVEEKYCPDNGRPSMDPVMLIKIPFIQYLYGIKSMRQTIKEIEVNVAYRWFLGLDMLDPVPHFSTFGKIIHAVLKIPIFLNRFLPGYWKNVCGLNWLIPIISLWILPM